MLADQRAIAIHERFRRAVAADPQRPRSGAGFDALFAGFNDTLRKAMVRETELFFESQVREDRPIPDLLRADYTYPERAARPPLRDQRTSTASRFRRVTLTDDRRHGLLGQASVLTMTLVREPHLGGAARQVGAREHCSARRRPPPPPNVPPLKENDGKSKPTTLRERMEQHRDNPVCASCHTRMDPLGFALEHFDAVGQWRETDSGRGRSTRRSRWMASSSTARRPSASAAHADDEFVRTVTEKMLTYALGRGLEYYDAPAVRQLVRDMKAQDYKLVVAGARDRPEPAVQMRRGGDRTN